MSEFRKIKVGDGELATYVDGEGEAIIFLHGDGFDSREFENYVQKFSKSNNVIRVDLRGFGKSDLPGKSPYSFHNDVLKVMDELKIQSGVIIGHSLGAAVGIDLAIASPDRVKALILISPGLGGYKYSPDVTDGINKTVALAKSGDLANARELWMKHPLLQSNDPEVRERIRQMVSFSSGYRWYGENQPEKLHPLAAERLSEIKCPTLIILGQQDCPDMSNIAKKIQLSVTNSKLEYVSGGHMAVMENEVKIGELIYELIKQVS
jgi:pimeloyl-ACP methyl ester carboxylesterase